VKATHHQTWESEEFGSFEGTECNTGWRREKGKFEIIRKKNEGNLTKLYLILKMCSTRVEILLGITFFYKLRQLSAVHFAVHILKMRRNVFSGMLAMFS
jgi:hypothetical protein